MKNLFYLFLAITLIGFTSCDDDDDPSGAGQTLSQSVDASSKTDWQYFSFKDGTIVGTGKNNDEDNATWFARKDWDIAISTYHVRTNSGLSTSVGSTGGVYTCDADVKYFDLVEVPAGSTFAVDKVIPVAGHGGTTDYIKSNAQVIQFELKEDGSMVMPPKYLPSPIYIFKTADGKETYKVNFTQYKNADGVSGHVEFDYAILY
ncbi:hypothetical protein EYV94_23600 [Puteibacter caeruleilacunae]|nr:hypothetical protein EYV94_23600 [Puteibacter caeruleilacunae]